MACEGCVENVTKALQARACARAIARAHARLTAGFPSPCTQAAKGVVSVSVDLASGVATLGVRAETAFDAMNDAARLAEVVKSVGFEAQPIL